MSVTSVCARKDGDKWLDMVVDVVAVKADSGNLAGSRIRKVRESQNMVTPVEGFDFDLRSRVSTGAFLIGCPPRPKGREAF